MQVNCNTPDSDADALQYSGFHRIKTRLELRMSNNFQLLYMHNIKKLGINPKKKCDTGKPLSHLPALSSILAPPTGLEPVTLRLTAECSAIELRRSNHDK